MWPSWICLLYGLVSVTCARLWDCKLRYSDMGVRHGSPTDLINFLSTIEVGLIWVWISHKGHSCGERNVRLSSSASHMLCRKIPIHDKGSNELIPWEELARLYVWVQYGHTRCIFVSNHLVGLCLAVDTQGRIWPLIHYWRDHPHADVQAHCASYSLDLATGGMPAGVVCIDSMWYSQCIAHIIRRVWWHTGTWWGNIWFVMHWSFE